MQETGQARLQVHLLGAPHLTWQGKEWVIPRRQVRGLFYRLAVERRTLSRSYLAGLFWGDMPECNARRNLSRLLTYLDRALPAPDLLRCEIEHISLASDNLWVDTGAIAQAWEAWLRTGSIRQLQSVVNLYGGDFLAGFELPGNGDYSAWLQLEQARLHEGHLAALETLVEVETEQGEIETAIRHARRYLQQNELGEDMHRRLIQLYGAQGDRMAGVRQYEHCLAVLERELGVRPDKATESAYRELFQDLEPALREEPTRIMWTALPSLPAPFVGRQAALGLLEQSLAAARTGRGSILLLAGEPGIGKSRLIQEFAAQARLRTRVLFGAATRGTLGSPYQPVVEALRSGCRYPGMADSVARTWLSEAARVLPELTELHSLPEQPPQLDLEAGQARLFEALYRLMLGFTHGGYTLVLCLEDLHWADASTLDWLAYTGRRLSGTAILILGSVRTDETRDWKSWFTTMRRRENFKTITLQGLDRQEISRLCTVLVEKSSPEPRLVDYLHQISGGNPFYLLEVMRAAAEAGQNLEDIRDDGLRHIPETVIDLVAVRVNHLSHLARQVLEAGAVLGSTFSFPALVTTAGRSEAETLDSLAELAARHFVDQGEAGYRFCHEISREVVYAGLSYWRRRRLHNRAADVLAKLTPMDWPALAWQYTHAGELRRAAGYLIQAGQAAKGVYAQEEARDYFQQALDLLGTDSERAKTTQAAAENRRMKIQALYERGWVLRLLGEMEAYTRDLEEVERIAQELGDPKELAHLYWQQAYNLRWFCRYPAAWQAAERGLELAKSIEAVFLETACRREMGLNARETGDYATAARELEWAYRSFCNLGHSLYVIHTCSNLATLYNRKGELAEACRWAQTALEACDEHGLGFERRLPLGDLGVVEAGRGNNDAAREYLQASLVIARQISDRTQEIYCQGHLGWLEHPNGDLLSGRVHLENALTLAVQVGSLSEQSWLQSGLAEIFLHLGDPGRAAGYAQAALELAQHLGRAPDAQQAEGILRRCT